MPTHYKTTLKLFKKLVLQNTFPSLVRCKESINQCSKSSDQRIKVKKSILKIK